MKWHKAQKKPKEGSDLLLVISPSQADIEEGFTEPYITMGSYREGEFIDVDDPFNGQRTSHWMQLPELPKE